MSRTYTASIFTYDDKHGRAGRLLGKVAFTDGKSLKVWDPVLHQQCKALAPLKAEVTYQIRHSAKWGDALEMIESTKADHELYDAARAQDEQRGRVKVNSFLGHRITKGNRAEPVDVPVASIDITQANALPPNDDDLALTGHGRF